MDNSEELNLVTLAQEYSDEDSARALLESLRWPNGPVCPHCGFNEIYTICGEHRRQTAHLPADDQRLKE
jgi:hypothetical protein